MAWNAAVYFMADDGVTGRQIWRSDGVTVTRVSNLSGGYSPEKLTAGTNGVYFVYDEPTLGAEVWWTDGVSTAPVTDIDPLAGDSYPTDLTWVGDRLYFEASEPVTGYELWWTDGSQVGQVADLWPGTASSSPSDLVAAGGRLVFAADDGVAGRELWITDGTTVRRLPEAWPGAGASTPLEVAVDLAATRIFYSALGPTTWREPYPHRSATLRRRLRDRQQLRLVGERALRRRLSSSASGWPKAGNVRRARLAREGSSTSAPYRWTRSRR